MGRNWVPKLDWDEGVRHVVYERETKTGKEVLACFWADGFYECVASAFESGFRKGFDAGREAALRDVRRTIGVDQLSISAFERDPTGGSA